MCFNKNILSIITIKMSKSISLGKMSNSLKINNENLEVILFIVVALVGLFFVQSYNNSFSLDKMPAAIHEPFPTVENAAPIEEAPSPNTRDLMPNLKNDELLPQGPSLLPDFASARGEVFTRTKGPANLQLRADPEIPENGPSTGPWLQSVFKESRTTRNPGLVVC